MSWLKTLHIAAIAVWLGNFVVTGVWSMRGFSSRQNAVRRFAAREILFSDVVFTLLAGAAVVGSGIALALQEHLSLLGTRWLRDALEVIIASTLVWCAILLPLEVAMYRRAAADAPARFLFLIWSVAGWIVTLALFAVIYLMVAKPV